MARSTLCKFGMHQFVDFPDPNPETYGMREAEGYRACMRCVKTKDVNVYERGRHPFSGRAWWPI